MIKKILCVVLFISTTVYAAGGPALVETSPIKTGVVNPLQKFVGTINFENKSCQKKKY